MIRSRKETERDLTVHICAGMITVEELLSAIKRLYDEQPTQNHLWDFTEADLLRITGAEIQRIADFAKAYAPNRRGGKTAIVTSTVLGFGLGRMYETYAEIAGQQVEIQVFRSLEDAHGWLDEGFDLVRSEKRSS